MEYLLIIYICSAIDQECIVPKQGIYTYPKPMVSHSSCVKNGLGEAFDILYGEKFFTDKLINEYELYPKFSCEKIETGEPA